MSSLKGVRGRRATALMCALAACVSSLHAQSSQLPRTEATPLEIPKWAFPSTSSDIIQVKPPFDSLTPIHIPGAPSPFTMSQIKNQFGPPDWFPSTHPRAPAPVSRGRLNAVAACGYCHLLDGQGRPENAMLAGLNADYFIRQVADLKSRARRGVIDTWGPTANMHRAADSATTEEVAEAARYFAAIRPKGKYTVVEQATVPMFIEIGGLYAVRAGTDSQPLGQRIIEVAEDATRHEMRDPSISYRAYVPPGSIAAGRKIARNVASAPGTACITCHGPQLHGLTTAPPLAGRSSTYMFRQLLAFRNGTRNGETSGPMRLVASMLTVDQMIAAVAYAGSLPVSAH